MFDVQVRQAMITAMQCHHLKLERLWLPLPSS
jgi:hypothetical protein